MSDLAKVLENFCRLDGVQGALILNAGGELVDNHAPAVGDLAPLVQLVSQSLTLGRQAADTLGKSPVNHQYLEFAHLQITSEILKNQNVLVVCAKTGANLGRIRLEIKKTKPDVEKLLA